MDKFLDEALAEALKGFNQGGIPIGSVLVIDEQIVGRGHNRRIQAQSPILHAEMDCLASAGRLTAAEYSRATIYSTLSPCDMCSGAILLYKIPVVIIGENRTFQGPEAYLQSRGVTLRNLDDHRCFDILQRFIADHPTDWYEDIGV